jgi:hypothetical protein
MGNNLVEVKASVLLLSLFREEKKWNRTGLGDCIAFSCCSISSHNGMLAFVSGVEEQKHKQTQENHLSHVNTQLTNHTISILFLVTFVRNSQFGP